MIESSEWPPDRANVTLNVGGDLLGIPFLTKPMLDLWVHALVECRRDDMDLVCFYH